ncbi:hypothetical protein COOONC_03485 [Cooperia oncophora]
MSLRAPETPDTFEELLHDIKTKIITRITHWQHPRFHAFYPSGPSYSNTLGYFITHALTTLGDCDRNFLILGTPPLLFVPHYSLVNLQVSTVPEKHQQWALGSIQAPFPISFQVQKPEAIVFIRSIFNEMGVM